MCDHFKTHLFVEQGWYPQLVEVQVNRLTDPYNFFCLPESRNFTGAWSNSSYHVLTINKNCSYSCISVNYKHLFCINRSLKTRCLKRQNDEYHFIRTLTENLEARWVQAQKILEFCFGCLILPVPELFHLVLFLCFFKSLVFVDIFARPVSLR